MSGTVVLGARPPRTGDPGSRLPLIGSASWRDGGPLLFAVLNAIAFLIVRPGVSDLWAARARADASAHGVGLTYWFSWFSGASTPGSYSVLTPYLSRLLTSEVVLALSAVATVAICSVLLRATQHPVAASYLAAVTTCINLWQGRVPFVFGCAVAAGSLLALRGRRWVLGSALGFLSLLGSPVSAAFLGIALAAMWLTRAMPRRSLLLPMGTLLAGAVLIIVVFGNPGPEPLTAGLIAGMSSLLIAFLLARPPKAVRVTLYLSLFAVLAMSVVPDGMGGNFARFVWFCLPVAVVSLTPGRRAYLAALAAIAVAVGSVGLFFDLRGASGPSSSVDYYKPLTAELGRLPHLADYRLEIVDDGTHTGSYALLDHATLARGFETQTDLQYNAAIRTQKALPDQVYRHWLDQNAVGYVAANLHPPKVTAESSLILDHRPSYLTDVWHNADWVVLQVSQPTPIVTLPATLISIDQATMTVNIPCACAVTVRTRWSPLLTAVHEDQTPSDVRIARDPTGFAVLTTSEPGHYVLEGR
ncbi:MAG: hypothetical protein ACRDWT_20785 [Jatrophihabitantaceae bacterium]